MIFFSNFLLNKKNNYLFYFSTRKKCNNLSFFCTQIFSIQIKKLTIVIYKNKKNWLIINSKNKIKINFKSRIIFFCKLVTQKRKSESYGFLYGLVWNVDWRKSGRNVNRKYSRSDRKAETARKYQKYYGGVAKVRRQKSLRAQNRSRCGT